MSQQPPLRHRIITLSLLSVAAIYFLVPVYWLTVSATKDTGDLFGTFGFWFANPHPVDYLHDVLTYDDGIYVTWMLNSLLYAGVGALAATLLSAAAGYALAKFVFRGREAIFNVILAGVLIPGTALALPLYLLFSEVGLANTYWAVLVPSVVSPFGVYLCRIYASAAVPDSLLEAARIDGAGETRIFGTVVLRLMSPALVTVFLFQFVHIWNNFFLPLVMLNDSDLYPIQLGLVGWQGYADRAPELYQYTVGGAFMSVIPLMVLMGVLQRYWRTGLAEGSVKT
ncbi:carbohydrate ABC transporter permease [Streptomyces buecherae]|uniref:Carbohydrate ABC transporter permease n=1 Tax=Streptomyces buecherae TaxID=2763006 RepID=A0A7G8KIC0_9ACTN|nr:carbohydrate ABC transporter permease [Streptomyces buecherae]MBC3986286.1 carbohydrate ABC transporter permease [Streptomyces buecherae]MBC3989506.1 carbohydrate ABC transporter permease [Streptomyces buecherae]QKW49585.1 carbohydrate ABC transporter permease [Streptomyces buecherae]QNJ42803.1 carbohydrate ABC transporter permease [Streptomyces buecherae]